MKRPESAPVLDQLVAPLGDCLTPESAQRLLALKADPKLQARVDDLAGRHRRGELTPEEQAEIRPLRFLQYLRRHPQVEGTRTPRQFPR